MPKFIDLTGRKFGRWTVLDRAPNAERANGSRWNCICACGSVGVVQAGNLSRGMSQNCGCLARERTSATRLRHGYAKTWAKTPEYRTWTDMKKRCYCKSRPGYKYYGARGIKVCDRWRNDFAAFLADMGPKPTGMSLDRKNNDGDYEPDNCRWATPSQQGRNTRRTAKIEIGGVIRDMSEWSEVTSIAYSTIRARRRRGKTGYSLIAPVNADTPSVAERR